MDSSTQSNSDPTEPTQVKPDRSPIYRLGQRLEPSSSLQIGYLNDLILLNITSIKVGLVIHPHLFLLRTFMIIILSIHDDVMNLLVAGEIEYKPSFGLTTCC